MKSTDSNFGSLLERFNEILGDAGDASLKDNKISVKFFLERSSADFTGFDASKTKQTLIYKLLPESREYSRSSTQNSVSISGREGPGPTNGHGGVNGVSFREIGGLVGSVQSGMELQRLQKELELALNEDGWEEKRGWLRKKLGF